MKMKHSVTSNICCRIAVSRSTFERGLTFPDEYSSNGRCVSPPLSLSLLSIAGCLIDSRSLSVLKACRHKVTIRACCYKFRERCRHSSILFVYFHFVYFIFIFHVIYFIFILADKTARSTIAIIICCPSVCL